MKNTDKEYIKLLSFLLSLKISRKLGIKLTMDKAREILYNKERI